MCGPLRRTAENLAVASRPFVFRVSHRSSEWNEYSEGSSAVKMITLLHAFYYWTVMSKMSSTDTERCLVDLKHEHELFALLLIVLAQIVLPCSIV